MVPFLLITFKCFIVPLFEKKTKQKKTKHKMFLSVLTSKGNIPEEQRPTKKRGKKKKNEKKRKRREKMTLSFDELNWDTKPSSAQPLPAVSSPWSLSPRPTSSSSCYCCWPAPPTWPPQHQVHRSEVNAAPGTRSRMPSRWELNLHPHLHLHLQLQQGVVALLWLEVYSVGTRGHVYKT